jgi:endonuclease YncB( thermonuclease family)
VMRGRDQAIVLLAVGAAVAMTLTNCEQQPTKQTVELPADADSSIVSEIVGLAIVSDGDTLRVGPRRIRLDGIEAPGSGAMCGPANIYRSATDALRQLTASQEVRCRISDLPDSEGRDVAQCRAGDVDVNARMVGLGMARASEGAYAAEQTRARAAGLGVWAAHCGADIWDEDASR